MDTKIENIDCNFCDFISIKECEQHDKGVPHICTYYNQRVFHRTNNREHQSRLHPCQECIDDLRKNNT